MLSVLFPLLLLLHLTITSSTFSSTSTFSSSTFSFAAAHDGVVRKSSKPPPSVSAPLTPSLQCSACEITCREVANKYNSRSKHDKFYGTDVELAEVVDTACSEVATSKYALRQENFGTHLKVFADPKVHFDVQYTEPPQFFHERDELRYANAVLRLRKFCETFVEKFSESHFRHHIRARSDEDTLRQDMCLHNATKLCTDDALKPYREIEERRRRRWKKRKASEKLLEEKLAQELSSRYQEQVDEQERLQQQEDELESMSSL